MKKKIPIFYHIKCSPMHRLGNVITSFIALFDAIINILTLGFVNTNLPMSFTMFRLGTKLYGDPKRPLKTKN